jgi:ParB family chromosome partitioning protein
MEAGMPKKTRSMRAATEELLQEFAEDAGLPGLLDTSAGGAVIEIPLDDIKPNPRQPRQSWDHARIGELAASIMEQGVLQPILVRPYRGKYQIVAGERRWRAAQQAGLPTIPALVREWDERMALLASLVENIQREDLNQVDRGRALRELKAVLGDVSWEKVGQRVGLTKRRVLQLISLSELPEDMQEAIRGGEINEKHGRALNLLADEPDKQRALFEEMRRAELTGEQALEAARLLADTSEEVAEAVEAAQRLVPRPGFSQPATTPQRMAERAIDGVYRLDRMTASHSLSFEERESLRETLEHISEMVERIKQRLREQEKREKEGWRG